MPGGYSVYISKFNYTNFFYWNNSQGRGSNVGFLPYMALKISINSCFWLPSSVENVCKLLQQYAAISYVAPPRICWIIETRIYRQRGNILCRRVSDFMECLNSNLPAAWQHPMAPHPGFCWILKLEFPGSVAISHGALPRIWWIIETRIYWQCGNIL